MLQRRSKGELLFDKVCDRINLLERDYFGLKYHDKYDSMTWLQLDKRMSKRVKGKLVFSRT